MDYEGKDRFWLFFDQQLSKPRTMLSLVYERERMFWVLLC
ncbi:hypothetical protein GBL_2826 [Geobacillus kaustophilus GBlys]|uniref:Uncharacterized protein n=1 Tax=Geobacillus kaustophilus GBlys TaxID=1337888 RepID=U2Y5H2_GEOKU|nr:hypothetical protein GBL_2826 [Geobacillus kaustophilus GBlys]